MTAQAQFLFCQRRLSKVAIAALKGHQLVNEIAAEFDVHPTQVNTWKLLLEGSAEPHSFKRYTGLLLGQHLLLLNPSFNKCV